METTTVLNQLRTILTEYYTNIISEDEINALTDPALPYDVTRFDGVLALVDDDVAWQGRDLKNFRPIVVKPQVTLDGVDSVGALMLTNTVKVSLADGSDPRNVLFDAIVAWRNLDESPSAPFEFGILAGEGPQIQSHLLKTINRMWNLCDPCRKELRDVANTIHTEFPEMNFGLGLRHMEIDNPDTWRCAKCRNPMELKDMKVLIRYIMPESMSQCAELENAYNDMQVFNDVFLKPRLETE